MAIAAWRKQQRIDLLRTIAMVTATVNPEKASNALNKLIEETFPEVSKDRERAVDRAMEIMEKEKEKTYAIAPVGDSARRGNSWAKAQHILRTRRKRP